METVETIPMPQPVVQGIKVLALDDAAQRACGAAPIDDAMRTICYPWASDESNKAVALGVSCSVSTGLTRVSRSDTAYGTGALPLRFCVVGQVGVMTEFHCERVKTFVDFARSFRSIVRDTPWICLETKWLKMPDFAENTKPIDIDALMLSGLSVPRSERSAAIGACDLTQPARGTSKLSAVVQRSSSEDDVLEIYAEPVDNKTLEFLRRC